MRGDPRLDAVRGALTYLGDAERLARRVHEGVTGWALQEQIFAADTDFISSRGRSPTSPRAAPLIAPGWAWALAGGLLLAYLLSYAHLTFVGLVAGGLLGFYGRFALTRSLAGELRRPGGEDIEEIHRALGEAARFMHEAGIDWVGGDPSVAPRPWEMLPQIRDTLTALRDAEVAALASGQS